MWPLMWPRPVASLPVDVTKRLMALSKWRTNPGEVTDGGRGSPLSSAPSVQDQQPGISASLSDRLRLADSFIYRPEYQKIVPLPKTAGATIQRESTSTPPAAVAPPLRRDSRNAGNRGHLARRTRFRPDFYSANSHRSKQEPIEILIIAQQNAMHVSSPTDEPIGLQHSNGQTKSFMANNHEHQRGVVSRAARSYELDIYGGGHREHVNPIPGGPRSVGRYDFTASGSSPYRDLSRPRRDVASNSYDTRRRGAQQTSEIDQNSRSEFEYQNSPWLTSQLRHNLSSRISYHLQDRGDGNGESVAETPSQLINWKHPQLTQTAEQLGHRLRTNAYSLSKKIAAQTKDDLSGVIKALTQYHLIRGSVPVNDEQIPESRYADNCHRACSRSDSSTSDQSEATGGGLKATATILLWAFLAAGAAWMGPAAVGGRDFPARHSPVCDTLAEFISPETCLQLEKAIKQSDPGVLDDLIELVDANLAQPDSTTDSSEPADTTPGVTPEEPEAQSETSFKSPSPIS
ncbi:uncharacterized protein LOC122368144 [Amphibalanus amphitrite]|uniref:uncharacterized protein LOC122368144 n=1 Tax=Amphibalanus amphitrite TaxID=1232801 RepID=UPI001C91AEA5|nr:uncharacterized protein LOC122368144 [Amphibalanus amphitrite]